MEDLQVVTPGIPNFYVWPCFIVPPNEHLMIHEMILSVSAANNAARTTTGVTYTTAMETDHTHCPQRLSSFENWQPDSDNPTRFQAEQFNPGHEALLEIYSFHMRPVSPLDILAHSFHLDGDLQMNGGGGAELNLGPAGILCGGEWGASGAANGQVRRQ
jgi:hypothetical protein